MTSRKEGSIRARDAKSPARRARLAGAALPGAALSLTAALALAWQVPARPGTELGNARFISYANDLHGIRFEYPDQWNVVDLGNAVNIVENESFVSPDVARERAPSAVPKSRMFLGDSDPIYVETLGAHDVVSILFDDSTYFPTPLSFARYVRLAHASQNWSPTLFLGRTAYEAHTGASKTIVVMKDERTAMEISYPLGVDGEPLPLVAKTISSLSLR